MPQFPSPMPTSQNATSLDELVSGAARDAEKASDSAPNGHAGSKTGGAGDDKKSKKEKDKNVKMVYSDNEVSPEEKMARLPRYAFAPEGKVGA